MFLSSLQPTCDVGVCVCVCRFHIYSCKFFYTLFECSNKIFFLEYYLVQ